MNGDIDGRVRQYEDGKYRWVYEFNLFRNPSILLVIYKIFFWIGVGEWVLSTLFSLGRRNFFWDGFLDNTKTFGIITAGLLALTTLGYVIYALMMGGKYCVVFEMDEEGVRHTQLDSQFKKAKVISALTVLAGAAAGDPGAVGTGLLAGSRNSMYSGFGSPAKVRAFPGRDTIKIDRTFSHNQVYAEDADFDFVYRYIISRIPIKEAPTAAAPKASDEVKSFLHDDEDKLNGRKLLALFLALANVLLLALIVKGGADKAKQPAEAYFSEQFEIQPYTSEDHPDYSGYTEFVEGSDRNGDSEDNGDPENAEPTQSQNEPVVYNASTPPAPAEFMWFTNGVCRTWQPPAGATRVVDVQSISGDWKCLILYCPELDFSKQGFAFCNTNLSGDASALTTTFRWNTLVFGGQTIDQENEANAVFTGSFSDGVVTMSGPGAFRLEQFYELDGKQYAFGHYTPPDGESAVIAMVRP